jgi:hypothetical protein
MREGRVGVLKKCFTNILIKESQMTNYREEGGMDGWLNGWIC